jgi:hypothetical protein
VVLCYQFFETKALDFLVLLDSVHDDLGIYAFEVGLGDGLLLVAG